MKFCYLDSGGGWVMCGNDRAESQTYRINLEVDGGGVCLGLQARNIGSTRDLKDDGKSTAC